MTGCVQRFDRVPPMLCRMLARTCHGLKPMTLDELSERSGLCKMRIVRLSKLVTWESVPLGVIAAFSEACGVNILSPCEQIKFLKRRKMVYMRNATAEQRKMLARLMAGLRQPAHAQSTA